MQPTEGVSAAQDRKRRVFFWFVCSALGGVCAREMLPHEPDQIVAETFRIAEKMTDYWLEHYENADV